MKVLVLLSFLFSSAFAQVPNDYLKSFDSKIYSLKNKGIKDFVVDIENEKITKQLNDQKSFGKIDELIFRVYWTASPERIAIEIIGLPGNFRELREQLKMNALSAIESLLPLSTIQKFAGYKFSNGKIPKELIAEDTTGIAPVPSYVFKFDDQDKLVEIIGNKPVGTLVVKPVYTRDSFADGKWVLSELITKTSEGGISMTITKDHSYTKSSGIGVLSEVEIVSERKISLSEEKTDTATDVFTFKNYKIDSGEALKYFLGEGSEKQASGKTE